MDTYPDDIRDDPDYTCIITHVYTSIYRTVKSVISVWMDTYPDDFRDDPDYTCLRTLEEFSKVHVPDSDLATRAHHKMEKFQREAEGKSGTVIYRKAIVGLL